MDRRHNDQKKTTIYKTSHRKQRSPRHHTENNDLQNITQKTTIYKTLHRKQRSTKHHTENNDLQNITQKTKDRATRIQLKLGVYSCVLKSQAVLAQHVTPIALLLLQTR